MNNFDLQRSLSALDAFQTTPEGGFFSNKAFLDIETANGVTFIKVHILNFFGRLVRRFLGFYGSLRIAKVANFIKERRDQLFLDPRMNLGKLKNKLSRFSPEEFNEKFFSTANCLYEQRVREIELWSKVIMKNISYNLREQKNPFDATCVRKELLKDVDCVLGERSAIRRNLIEFYYKQDDTFSDAEAQGLSDRLQMFGEVENVQKHLREEVSRFGEQESQDVSQPFSLLSSFTQELETSMEGLSQAIDSSGLWSQENQNIFTSELTRIKNGISQIHQDFLNYPIESLCKRNFMTRLKRIKDNLLFLEGKLYNYTMNQAHSDISQEFLPEIRSSHQARQNHCQLFSNEMQEKKTIQQAFEDKLPASTQRGSHPKYDIVERQFNQIAQVYPFYRKARGNNDCSYLSFGIGYLKHISQNEAKLLDLLSISRRHSEGGPLFQKIQDHLYRGMNDDLECVAGDPAIMQDLVLVLRKEIADYVFNSAFLDEDRRYKILRSRLNKEHEKMIPDPETIEEFLHEGVSQNQLEGGKNLEEKCCIIATPSLRPSEAIEYDALSRRFECPFVDISFKGGQHLRNAAEGKEYEIRHYPLEGHGRGYTLQNLVNREIVGNETFALLLKDEGHTDVLFAT